MSPISRRSGRSKHPTWRCLHPGQRAAAAQYIYYDWARWSPASPRVPLLARRPPMISAIIGDSSASTGVARLLLPPSFAGCKPKRSTCTVFACWLTIPVMDRRDSDNMADLDAAPHRPVWLSRGRSRRSAATTRVFRWRGTSDPHCSKRRDDRTEAYPHPVAKPVILEASNICVKFAAPYGSTGDESRAGRQRQRCRHVHGRRGPPPCDIIRPDLHAESRVQDGC